MKEKEIIDRLRILQSVRPDDNTLQLIRKRIPSQIAARKSFLSRATPLIPFFAFAGIIFLLVVFSFFSTAFDNVIVTARIAFAPNHYEKAKIALANLQNKFFSLQENSSDTQKIVLLTDSLALANTEMSGLKLIGEQGKYTAYQCKELYESYHKDLEQMEMFLRFNKTSSATVLSSEIEQYEGQIQVRLSNYKQKKWIDNGIQE